MCTRKAREEEEEEADGRRPGFMSRRPEVRCETGLRALLIRGQTDAAVRDAGTSTTCSFREKSVSLVGGARVHRV